MDKVQPIQQDPKLRKATAHSATSTRDKGKPPNILRLRKRGEKILHSKYVVILVIILTIVDCSLVIAELILDLYSVKKTLSATEGQTFKFIRNIRSKYPDEVMSNASVFSVFERISEATILWNSSMELDLFLRCHNLSMESTTINSVGISFPSRSSFEPIRKRREETLNLYTQTIHSKNNPELYGRRLRRLQRSNTDYSNLQQDNEKWLRLKIENLFRGYIRRVRRYIPPNVKGFRENVFHEGDTTNGIKGNDDDHGRNEYETRINNDANRFLDDLLVLHRQLSDYFRSQENQSYAHQGIEQGSMLSSVGVSNDDREGGGEYINNDKFGVKSDSLSYDDDSDDKNVAVEVPSDSLYNNVMFSDFPSDDSQYKSDVHEGDNIHSNAKNVGSHKKGINDDEEAHMRRELHHSKEMEIAHKLHYASVCVVSVLLIEVTMKIVCAGSHFVKRKIEVFDAVVIVTSVVVDLIFIKGLSEFAVDDSIFVLVLLLPWRVIRVVNSLVMAVIDHEHVKLRLLYSRKKKLDKTVESLRNEVDELKGMMQDVRSFCIKEGIGSARIDGMLGKFAPRRRKDSKFYTLVKLVMSTASINNNDNESVSSSSIENDLRHYTNRDSVLNEATSNDGTIASLKGYLSVPSSNGDSHSVSEAESIVGDHVNTSPSIYITSPVSNDGMFSFCDVEMGDNEVFAHHDTSECIEEEDSVANIDVTSSTTNSNTKNGVAFYVGSQTSFNSGLFFGSLLSPENDHQSFLQIGCSDALRESASSNAVDACSLVFNPHFGQYLTVPHCTVSVLSGTNTISISSNYNEANTVDGCISSSSATYSLPQGSNCREMRRSVSDNVGVTLGKSPYDGVFQRVLYGSPIPARRFPDIRTRRKNYTKYRSESDDDSAGLLKRDFKNRLRRFSGDPHATPGCPPNSKRARSHSPSPMTLLSVPGNNRLGREITCSSSRSMNDVSFSANHGGQRYGDEGRILRRSCLSLNSEGQKRRAKSPHRVSFKVS